MISFCRGFFAKRSLSNAIAFGIGQSGRTDEFKLTNYDNRGTFTSYLSSTPVTTDLDNQCRLCITKFSTWILAPTL
jgi:hypothetical protein